MRQVLLYLVIHSVGDERVEDPDHRWIVDATESGQRVPPLPVLAVVGLFDEGFDGGEVLEAAVRVARAACA